MNNITLQIILGGSVVVWAVICAFIYRYNRHAAWLAGSTVALGLFFLGATAAASVMSKNALFLVPLWIGVLILHAVHLYAARAISQSSFDDSLPAFAVGSHQANRTETQQKMDAII